MKIEPGSLVAVSRVEVHEDAEWAISAARELGGGEALAAAMPRYAQSLRDASTPATRPPSRP
jgi:hypothetical protein